MVVALIKINTELYLNRVYQRGWGLLIINKTNCRRVPQRQHQSVAVKIGKGTTMQIVFKKKCKKDKVDLNKLFIKTFSTCRWFSNVLKNKIFMFISHWIAALKSFATHALLLFSSASDPGPQRF
jgi:hypothetical protein